MVEVNVRLEEDWWRVVGLNAISDLERKLEELKR